MNICILTNHHGSTGQPIHCDTTENQCCQTGIYPVWHHTPLPRPHTQLFILLNLYLLSQKNFFFYCCSSYCKCRFYSCARDLVDKNIVYRTVCFKIREYTTWWQPIQRPKHVVVKTSYVETPLSNTNINNRVWLHLSILVIAIRLKARSFFDSYEEPPQFRLNWRLRGLQTRRTTVVALSFTAFGSSADVADVVSLVGFITFLLVCIFGTFWFVERRENVLPSRNHSVYNSRFTVFLCYT